MSERRSVVISGPSDSW